MQIVVRKWGDSLGIRIPMDYCRKLNINPNTKLEILIKDQKITMSVKKSKLDEVLEQMTPDTFHSALLEGNPVGNEEW
ncbi:MAG: hypothetical protein B7Y25_06975 [Alphaproteobacteria bacterium 16-39-46]|nr:MAG: hypothetical protein B7Y25_06975 [Alphaproteobacteria bacterium 16-39-46]OZA41982.1 MAG: hypothetical protein B7X84_07090 [Alphaproteobacteria bacterium 17-39-52]HQS84635.1 AbrB/MazE/SpoVT family DNA-binding domain-containing protein [Alphaproteobacteria bacterium]HQS94447.1 AbrB/MazE/SpoVT family DNA-binding domain-containing protein [Alphaproteobacteria bacterium]